MNRNLKQYKPSDFKDGFICTMHQRLILKALVKTKWNLEDAMLLNYNSGTVTVKYYKQVIENLRIDLTLRKII